MTKTEAKKLFGNNGAALARAIGVSRSRISQWPEVLEQREVDLVTGAAVRLGKLPELQANHPQRRRDDPKPETPQRRRDDAPGKGA